MMSGYSFINAGYDGSASRYGIKDLLVYCHDIKYHDIAY